MKSSWNEFNFGSNHVQTARYGHESTCIACSPYLQMCVCQFIPHIEKLLGSLLEVLEELHVCVLEGACRCRCRVQLQAAALRCCCQRGTRALEHAVAAAGCCQSGVHTLEQACWCRCRVPIGTGRESGPKEMPLGPGYCRECRSDLTPACDVVEAPPALLNFVP